MIQIVSATRASADALAPGIATAGRAAVAYRLRVTGFSPARGLFFL